MSEHFKWTTTEHRRAAINAKRGKLFARLIENIEVATRTGGGDPAGNPTLSDTIQKAEKNLVPTDNITRAVKRGSGAEAGGANYETITYEGCGSGGVAFYAGCLIDNCNRTTSDVRLAFTRSGNPITDPGSVAFLPSRHGIVEITVTEDVDEDLIMEAVLEAGAEEVEDLGGGFVIESDPSDVVEVRKALQAAGIDYSSTETQFVVATEVELDLEGVVKIQCLVDALEDLDDVQNTYHNMTVSDEVRVRLEGEE